MIVAMLLDKEYDPPTALSFAVLLMLAVNPSAVTSVSLQLSAGCMMGIFMFSQPIQNYLLARLGSGKGKSLRAKLARWLSSGISISLSATVFTAPLSAFYFGTFSVLAVVTNLLTLWAVGLIAMLAPAMPMSMLKRQKNSQKSRVSSLVIFLKPLPFSPKPFQPKRLFLTKPEKHITKEIHQP